MPATLNHSLIAPIVGGGTIFSLRHGVSTGTPRPPQTFQDVIDSPWEDDPNFICRMDRRQGEQVWDARAKRGKGGMVDGPAHPGNPKRLPLIVVKRGQKHSYALCFKEAPRFPPSCDSKGQLVIILTIEVLPLDEQAKYLKMGTLYEHIIQANQFNVHYPSVWTSLRKDAKRYLELGGNFGMTATFSCPSILVCADFDQATWIGKYYYQPMSLLSDFGHLLTSAKEHEQAMDLDTKTVLWANERLKMYEKGCPFSDEGVQCDGKLYVRFNKGGLSTSAIGKVHLGCTGYKRNVEGHLGRHQNGQMTDYGDADIANLVLKGEPLPATVKFFNEPFCASWSPASGGGNRNCQFAHRNGTPQHSPVKCNNILSITYAVADFTEGVDPFDPIPRPAEKSQISDHFEALGIPVFKSDGPQRAFITSLGPHSHPAKLQKPLLKSQQILRDVVEALKLSGAYSEALFHNNMVPAIIGADHLCRIDPAFVVKGVLHRQVKKARKAILLDTGGLPILQTLLQNMLLRWSDEGVRFSSDRRYLQEVRQTEVVNPDTGVSRQCVFGTCFYTAYALLFFESPAGIVVYCDETFADLAAKDLHQLSLTSMLNGEVRVLARSVHDMGSSTEAFVELIPGLLRRIEMSCGQKFELAWVNQRLGLPLTNTIRLFVVDQELAQLHGIGTFFAGIINKAGLHFEKQTDPSKDVTWRDALLVCATLDTNHLSRHMKDLGSTCDQDPRSHELLLQYCRDTPGLSMYKTTTSFLLALFEISDEASFQKYYGFVSHPQGHKKMRQWCQIMDANNQLMWGLCVSCRWGGGVENFYLWQEDGNKGEIVHRLARYLLGRWLSFIDWFEGCVFTLKMLLSPADLCVDISSRRTDLNNLERDIIAYEHGIATAGYRDSGTLHNMKHNNSRHNTRLRLIGDNQDRVDYHVVVLDIRHEGKKITDLMKSIAELRSRYKRNDPGFYAISIRLLGVWETEAKATKQRVNVLASATSVTGTIASKNALTVRNESRLLHSGFAPSQETANPLPSSSQLALPPSTVPPSTQSLVPPTITTAAQLREKFQEENSTLLQSVVMEEAAISAQAARLRDATEALPETDILAHSSSGKVVNKKRGSKGPSPTKHRQPKSARLPSIPTDTRAAPPGPASTEEFQPSFYPAPSPSYPQYPPSTSRPFDTPTTHKLQPSQENTRQTALPSPAPYLYRSHYEHQYQSSTLPSTIHSPSAPTPPHMHRSQTHPPQFPHTNPPPSYPTSIPQQSLPPPFEAHEAHFPYYSQPNSQQTVARPSNRGDQTFSPSTTQLPFPSLLSYHQAPPTYLSHNCVPGCGCRSQSWSVFALLETIWIRRSPAEILNRGPYY
ncbi:hypothetical protein P7C70_g4732, partial [Phenoliferia sp. Uapishka_3]